MILLIVIVSIIIKTAMILLFFRFSISTDILCFGCYVFLCTQSTWQEMLISLSRIKNTDCLHGLVHSLSCLLSLFKTFYISIVPWHLVFNCGYIHVFVDTAMASVICNTYISMHGFGYRCYL